MIPSEPPRRPLIPGRNVLIFQVLPLELVLRLQHVSISHVKDAFFLWQQLVLHRMLALWVQCVHLRC
jgi:hypothetical protein